MSIISLGPAQVHAAKRILQLSEQFNGKGSKFSTRLTKKEYPNLDMKWKSLSIQREEHFPSLLKIQVEEPSIYASTTLDLNAPEGESNTMFHTLKDKPITIDEEKKSLSREVCKRERKSIMKMNSKPVESRFPVRNGHGPFVGNFLNS